MLSKTKLFLVVIWCVSLIFSFLIGAFYSPIFRKGTKSYKLGISQNCAWKDTLPIMEDSLLIKPFKGFSLYQKVYGNILLTDTNSIKYNAYVSGINPRLDSIEFIYHERRKIPLKVRRQPWHLTLGVGYGVGYENSQFYSHPYIGVQIGYEINWSWFSHR